MDPTSKTVPSSHEVPPRKLDDGTVGLCEIFKDKLNLKEEGQGALVSSVARKENSALNCNEAQSVTRSAKQRGIVRTLVQKFSQVNPKKETSSINRAVGHEIKNTPFNSYTSIKSMSAATSSLVTEKNNKKIVRCRSFSCHRYMTTGDENPQFQITDTKQRARRKSDSYHEDFSQEIKQSGKGNVDNVLGKCMREIEMNFISFNKQFDSATGKKRTRSQSTDNKQSVYATQRSDCGKEEEKDKNVRDQKYKAVNDNKGGKTRSQPSPTLESKPATNKTMDCLSRENISETTANGAHNGQTKESTTEMRKLKDDVSEGMGDKLCEGTQPRDNSCDVIAENINLPAFDGELNLENINYKLRILLEQVERIQNISTDNLQHKYDLKAFQVLLNFKAIAASGLLGKCMLNYGLENDSILRMFGELLQSFYFLASDLKDKLTKFEKTQVDSILQDLSGKVCENQDQGQSQTDPEVSVNNSGDTQSTTCIGLTKDDTASTSKRSSLDTKDALSQTDANCETCTQCGMDTVTVEKENEETITSVTLDTRRNVKNEIEKSDQRVERKVEVKNLQANRRIISQNRNVSKNEKVLLLLGASGCGKTTLVKHIACFYEGIKSPDEFLLGDTRRRIENLVEHSSVTAFTAYPENPNDPAITIIDTPGLNDSSGDLIQSRIDDLQRFLTDAVAQGLEVNAIGFVIQAHVARLTPSEKLVMEYVKRHFKKCSAHIIPLITFADSQKDPPVLKAMKEFKMNIGSHFLFNNSILTFDDNEEISDMDRLCWKRGFKGWQNICKLLLSLSAVKVSHIHSRQSSVAESAKSETKPTGSQAKKTKVASVQTDMNNCILKERERRDQSTNTETGNCENDCQKLLLSLSAVKISHIHSRQSSSAESAKSETKLLGLQAKKTEVASVQTDMNNCILKERERQNQSTNTETGNCEIECQKLMNLNDTRRETAELSAVQEALIRFFNLQDNRSYLRSTEWKTVREKVWKMAATAYQFVNIGMSCDEWVYSLATEILRESHTSRPTQEYLCVLALSETKPLVNIARAVIRNTKAEHNQIFRYGENHYIFKLWIKDLQVIVIENAMKTLQNALVANKMHGIMNTQSLLWYLCYEDESLGKFIHDVLLRNY